MTTVSTDRSGKGWSLTGCGARRRRMRRPRRPDAPRRRRPARPGRGRPGHRHARLGHRRGGARRCVPEPDTVVVHLSGALGLDVLAPHPRRASLHPLVPLPSAEVGRVRLRSGITFAVAGDPVAAELAACARRHGRGRRRRAPRRVPRRGLHRLEPPGGAHGPGGAGGGLGRGSTSTPSSAWPGPRSTDVVELGPAARADRSRRTGRRGHARPPPPDPRRRRDPRLRSRRGPGAPTGRRRDASRRVPATAWRRRRLGPARARTRRRRTPAPAGHGRCGS